VEEAPGRFDTELMRGSNGLGCQQGLAPRGISVWPGWARRLGLAIERGADGADRAPKQACGRLASLLKQT